MSQAVCGYSRHLKRSGCGVRLMRTSDHLRATTARWGSQVVYVSIVLLGSGLTVQLAGKGTRAAQRQRQKAYVSDGGSLRRLSESMACHVWNARGVQRQDDRRSQQSLQYRSFRGVASCPSTNNCRRYPSELVLLPCGRDLSRLPHIRKAVAATENKERKALFETSVRRPQG